MKGLPYGKYYSWQPESVSNDDTASVTINFGRAIPDINLNDYINALYFIKTFADEQSGLDILGWERVDGTTIKFLLEDYFSCNGTILIAYNKLLGSIDNVPNFTVPYEPDGVPVVIYLQETIDDMLTIQADISLTNVLSESISSFLKTPLESGLSEDISGQTLTKVTYNLTNNLSEGTVQTLLE